jgi:hypothetical protein
MANTKDDWVDVPLTQAEDDWVEIPVQEPGMLEAAGPVDAALKGAAQGATLGYSDEIIAAMKSAFGDSTYDEELKKYRSELEKAKFVNPTAYSVGDTAGVALTLYGTGAAGLVAKGATKVATKAAQVAVPVVKKVAASPMAKKVGELAAEVGVESAIGIPGLGSGVRVGKEAYEMIKKYLALKKGG